MNRQNILVVNDDGIGARGIHELAKALGAIANIYVCAPDRQRTAAGHGITVAERLLLKEESFPEAIKAYSCSGTPADCVKLGKRVFQEQGIPIHMVCSGINHGANLGTDVLYSGTVAAALEGIICGVPSIAFSCCSHEAVHFEVFEKLAPQVCTIAAKRMDCRSILNVNAPDLPLSKIKGLRCTVLGSREYEDAFEPEDLGEAGTYYDYSATAVVYEGLGDGIDVKGFQEDYVTITPLHFDLTDYSLANEMLGWGFTLEG